MYCPYFTDKSNNWANDEKVPLHPLLTFRIHSMMTKIQTEEQTAKQGMQLSRHKWIGEFRTEKPDNICNITNERSFEQFGSFLLYKLSQSELSMRPRLMGKSSVNATHFIVRLFCSNLNAIATDNEAVVCTLVPLISLPFILRDFLCLSNGALCW